MKVSANVVLSCQILTAHPLRTVLSILGVAIGIAAVVLMVAVGRGAEKEILDRIRALGTNLIVVQAAQARTVAGRQRQSETVTALTLADADAVAEECPSVALVAPAVSKSMTAYWQSRRASTTVEGMVIEGLDIRCIPLGSGRFYDETEDRTRQRVALVGQTVVDTLFEGTDPVGQRIKIGKVPFDVIGVLAARGSSSYGADQDNIILIPLETAMRRLLNITYIHTIYVQAQDEDLMRRAEEEVHEVIEQRHLRRRQKNTFTIQNQAELLETQRETTKSLTWLIASVAGIAMVVGGVGILAVMLISIRERTREIGLRRAIGARRRDIVVQFMLEAILLAATGGLFGAAVGIGVTHAASEYGGWQTVLSWPSVGVGMLFSITTGLFFGIYPAMRAARLEPIEALRGE